MCLDSRFPDIMHSIIIYDLQHYDYRSIILINGIVHLMVEKNNRGLHCNEKNNNTKSFNVRKPKTKKRIVQIQPEWR